MRYNDLMGSEENALFEELSETGQVAAVVDEVGNTLLDDDNIPNANQSLTCFSCDTPMRGLYCHACGNKNDNYRRSIWSLGVDLFQNITAFESRIWRSLWSLFAHPGRMGREFADGARQRWTSPARMFLATSLLLFGYVALSGTQIVALGALEKNPGPTLAGIHAIDDDGEKVTQSLHFFVRQADLVDPDLFVNSPAEDLLKGIREGRNDLRREEILDAIDEAIDDTDAEDLLEELSAFRDRLAASDEEGLGALLDSLPSAVDNALEANKTSVSITNASGTRIRLDDDGVTSLYQRLMRNPSIVNNQLNNKLKWAMFFMMPFAMIVGAVFIRGRDKAMLYDHLVHAAYVHAFSFILLFVFILLSQYTPIPSGVLLLTYVVILLIYLPMSARGMFRRGWFKSILTAYGVGSLYTFIMMITATTIIATALTAEAQAVSEAAEAAQAMTATSQAISTSTPASDR